MIIKKLSIKSFGKFKDKEIVFSDSLNIVYGNNEAGKSTIVSFIKAMIYGFGDKRGGKISLRDRYTPWDGSVIEGEIELSDTDQDIVIYRKSGNTKRTDILKVYDKLTGKEIDKSPEDIIGISLDSFEKTVFTPQSLTVFSGGSDEISAKLSNLSRSGDENTDFSKAINILETKKKDIIHKNLRGGRLFELENKISNLRLQESEEQKNTVKKAENYKKLREMELTLKNLNDKEKELSALQLKTNKQYLYNELHTKKELLTLSQKNLDEVKKEQLKLQTSISSYDLKNSKFSLNLVLFIIFLAVSFTYLPYSLILLIPSFIFMYFHIKNCKRIKCEREKYDQLLIKEKELNSEFEKLCKDEERAKLSVNSTEEKIINIYGMLEEIAPCEISFDENERNAVSREIISLTEQSSRLKTELDMDNSATCEEIRGMINTYEEERNELIGESNALSSAIEALSEAKNELSRNFAPQLNEEASKILDIITDGTHNSITASNNFSVTVSTPVSKEFNLFSNGTADQIYLSLRIALSKLIFKGCKTFLILDDSFNQYDDIRTENTINFLKELSKDMQIVVFSSRPLGSFQDIDIIEL